jgi:hypothetical protein
MVEAAFWNYSRCQQIHCIPADCKARKEGNIATFLARRADLCPAFFRFYFLLRPFRLFIGKGRLQIAGKVLPLSKGVF